MECNIRVFRSFLQEWMRGSDRSHFLSDYAKLNRRIEQRRFG